MVPSSKRQSRAPKMPAALKDRLKANPELQGQLFSQWLAHGEDWGKLVALEELMPANSQV